MKLLIARNVNEAFHNMLWWMEAEGEVEETRNGRARVMPGPVMTHYKCPWERVLFHRERDANPFFHLAEAIWMMAGSNKLDFVEYFNSNMAKFSDDGETLHGAYGHRWRAHFEMDQIVNAIFMLKDDPTTRRVVLTMWDPHVDMNPAESRRDLPCNTHIYFRIRNKRLETTVMCRSNDMVWGAYGANAVHFSFLHEFMAGAVGVGQGPMYQLSNNFHMYQEHWPLIDKHLHDNSVNPYETVMTVPMFDGLPNVDWQEFINDCEDIVTRGSHAVPENYFLAKVFMPMLRTWEARKFKEPYQGYLTQMPKCDWKMACAQWMDRRG